MKLRPLKRNDELEINLSIDEFKKECSVDKTTTDFVVSMDIEPDERPLSTNQRMLIFGRDMMTVCVIELILLLLSVLAGFHNLVEILWECCVTSLFMFNMIFSISCIIRYIGHSKHTINLYRKHDAIRITTGKIIGIIRPKYNCEIPIVKYEVDGKTYIACPNMFTKNNELESEIKINYYDDDPHKFFIEGSSYNQRILNRELIISIAYLITTAISLLLNF